MNLRTEAGDLEAQRQPRRWVGLYNTRAAARRARRAMLERGVPKESITLRAASSLPSASPTVRAPLSAWLGLLIGSISGGLSGALLAGGLLRVWSVEAALADWATTGVVFAFSFVLGLGGAAFGALLGLREEPNPRVQPTETALRVLTASAQQALDVDHAYEASGARDVRVEAAQVPLAA